MKQVQLQLPYRGKSMTLYTVLTDYNTQMFKFNVVLTVHRH